MAVHTHTVVLDGLAFPVCPRWHEGRLWFSDVHDRRVWVLDESGRAEVALQTADQPAGLGWLPDDRLLVVGMTERQLLRLDAEGLVPVAELSALAPFHCNDMVVDPQGRAYVGNYGFDLDAGAEPTGTTLVCVAPDGDAWVVVDQLLFPNGMVLTDGGHTLVVAESFAQRLSAYKVLPDGSLTESRVWADLRPNVPHGICLDADGAIWVADPVNSGVMRVIEGAGPVDWIGADQPVYGCALGGVDGRTLFLCTAASSNPSRTTELRSGRIETLRVDVPAAPVLGALD